MSKSVSVTPNIEWDEIKQWLQELNYSNYVQLFHDGGYDLWEILYDLSINDLKALGILPGHAKRIENKLKLKKEKEEKEGKKIKNQKKAINIPPPTKQNEIKLQLTQKQQHQQQILAAQQLQQLAAEGRRRKIRERFQQNALFAGGIKNKLFETMTRVLNGLQQELIQYNGKFAEPINEMNQRIVALQKLDVHNLDGIWDSNDGLFEPMMRNVKDIKKFNQNMWTKINEFHNLAELQIKQSIKQLQSQINVINQMKTQYLLKQQHMNAIKRQQQFIVNNSNNSRYNQAPLNTIVTNNAIAKNNQSAKVSNVKYSNITRAPIAPLNYKQFIQQQQQKRQRQRQSGVNINNAINLVNPIDINNRNRNRKPIAINVEKKKEIIVVEEKKKRKKQKSTVRVGRKPAYTSGELQMMKNYDNKKQTVADIIDLQRRMQSIFGIPRSAYGIAQKMYRMGVLSATLPKKLQALQDKKDEDKIKIGDGIMNVRKPRGKPRQTPPSATNSDSYYSSNDAVSSSSDDDISSNSSSDDQQIVARRIPLQHSPSSLSLFEYGDTSVPQRKPPSTNLRRYTQQEVIYIRKLIEEYPVEEAKVLFKKFRTKFTYWKEETEAYTKFYQKKWRLCKEKETGLTQKRKRQSPNININDASQSQNQPPPLKKLKLKLRLTESKVSISPKKERPDVSFDTSTMPKMNVKQTTQDNKTDIMPPPLPPPPINGK